MRRWSRRASCSLSRSWRWRCSRGATGPAWGQAASGRFPGATSMVVAAVVLVGVEILNLTFVGAKVWAGIYQTPPDPNSLQIEVQAEQFAFYFRYAGGDGRFGVMYPELANDATEN